MGSDSGEFLFNDALAWAMPVSLSSLTTTGDNCAAKVTVYSFRHLGLAWFAPLISETTPVVVVGVFLAFGHEHRSAFRRLLHFREPVQHTPDPVQATILPPSASGTYCRKSFRPVPLLDVEHGAGFVDVGVFGDGGAGLVQLNGGVNRSSRQVSPSAARMSSMWQPAWQLTTTPRIVSRARMKAMGCGRHGLGIGLRFRVGCSCVL